MKHTSMQLLRSNRESNPIMLDEFKVNKGDRNFKYGKENPWEQNFFTPEIFYQKLDYNHNNSVKAGL